MAFLALEIYTHRLLDSHSIVCYTTASGQPSWHGRAGARAAAGHVEIGDTIDTGRAALIKRKPAGIPTRVDNDVVNDVVSCSAVYFSVID